MDIQDKSSYHAGNLYFKKYDIHIIKYETSATGSKD